MGIDLRKVLRIAGDEEPGRQKLCAIMKDLYPYPEYIREINVLIAVFDSGIPKIIKNNGGLTKSQYIRSIEKIEREYGIDEYLAVKAIDAWGAAYIRPGVFSDYRMEDQDNKAFEWNQKAAEDGDTDAMSNLGVLYAKNLEYEKAIFWYRKAAEAGNATAMFNLGKSYRNGEGVEKDNREAVSWYRKAAKAGNAAAIVMS
jgi:tetratricopeptide (TPR) repeat protein